MEESICGRNFCGSAIYTIKIMHFAGKFFCGTIRSFCKNNVVIRLSTQLFLNAPSNERPGSFLKVQ